MSTRNFRKVTVENKLEAGSVVTSFLNTANIYSPTTQYNSVNFTDTANQSNCINIGFNATIQSGSNLLAIGFAAGASVQQSGAIAIGFQAGQSNQQQSAIAIGIQAGQISQGTNSIAIGLQAGQNTQNANSLAIGPRAGNVFLGTGAIAIGSSTNLSNSNSNTNYINIGPFGQSLPGQNAISIGFNAGGPTRTAFNSITIGEASASNVTTNTPSTSISIGRSSYGATAASTNAVFIGTSAGGNLANLGGIGIGFQAGQANSTNAINIGGYNTAVRTYGANSIYIGSFDGGANIPANTLNIGRNISNVTNSNFISINTSNTPSLLTYATSGFFVRPGPRISNTTGTQSFTMWFNSNTSEIFYN